MTGEQQRALSAACRCDDVRSCRRHSVQIDVESPVAQRVRQDCRCFAFSWSARHQRGVAGVGGNQGARELEGLARAGNERRYRRLAVFAVFAGFLAAGLAAFFATGLAAPFFAAGR